MTIPKYSAQGQGRLGKRQGQMLGLGKDHLSQLLYLPQNCICLLIKVHSQWPKYMEFLLSHKSPQL